MRRILVTFFIFLSFYVAIPSQAANFFVNDAATLIAAINTANSNGEADVITFTADITLTAVDNSFYGDSGLPIILVDGGNSLTIEGAGFTLTRDAAAPNFRFFYVDTGASLIINDLTLTNGNAVFEGGAIFSLGNLSIDNSNLNNNRTNDDGGAIYTQSGGTSLNINNSSFSNNQASSDGGAIYNLVSATISNSLFDNNQASTDGGGIYNRNIMTISTTTISNNRAAYGAGIDQEATLTVRDSSIIDNQAANYGGGIIIYGSTNNFSNVTISGNQAITNSGGGIYVSSSSPMIITNVTISDNAAGDVGGGVATETGSIHQFRNSIVAGNTATNSGNDCGYTFGATSANISTNNYNVLGTNGSSEGCPTGATDIIPAGGIASVLDPLANNSGATQTHALPATSPAIDAANNANCPATDQRGIVRGFDGNGTVDNPEVGDCDIGAFEYSLFPAYASTPAVSSTIDLGATAVGTEITSILDIQEVGDATLLVSLNSITGANAADFSVIGLATSIANGDSAQGIAIICSPSIVGILTATITFNTNDPIQPTATYDVTCEGLDATTVTNTVTITLPTGETVVVNAETEYVLKTVDNPFATVGQTVTYTIRAHNPKDIPLTQVVIYDVFDERLDNIQLVSTTHGAGQFNGRTLTVSGFTLQPGEEATIIVSARVAALRAGETIPNAAILESPNASVHVSNLALVGDNPEANGGGAAQVFLIPSQLPSTGESPFYFYWALWAGLGVVGISLLLIFARRKAIAKN